MTEPYPSPEDLANDEILQSVATRLLGTPTLSADDVQARGLNPEDRTLIHFTRPDGTECYPTFQFRGNAIHPVIVKVNTILNAHEDPLGVWDWWTGRNACLNDRVTPASLLDNPDRWEAVITAAAFEQI